MITTEKMAGSGLILDGGYDAGAWDAFLQSVEPATFCHLSGWRGIMTDVLGHESLMRAAVDQTGRIVGVLPLVRMKSRFFGHHLVSMPFLNYGGPVGSPSAQQLLSGWAMEEAKRTRADVLDLRNLAPAALAPELRPLARKITVVLELPASADTLWNHSFTAKLRSQVKRAQRENMTVRFGNDQVAPFYEVFARNMRDLGTPVLPRRLFDALARAFAGLVVFGVIYCQDTPVAAGCGFLWRGEFEMTWASSLREFNARAPNMLLYWSFMEQLIRQGAHTFNFGRCTPGGGTHRFKLQWGGRDVALGWSQWTRRAATAVPASDRGTFRLAASMWQRLPLAVANRLGPVLARRIPAF